MGLTPNYLKSKSLRRSYLYCWLQGIETCHILVAYRGITLILNFVEIGQMK